MIRKAGGVDGVRLWVPAVNLGLQGFQGGGKDRFGQAFVLGQQKLFNAEFLASRGLEAPAFLTREARPPALES